ncbi:IucA/IucC family protein [Streptomyces fragilis]|uniref:IucA/IucC family protein n=1 Tax=Streptomyces fragilis TaxID=67301 RepID=A0ABV2YQ75_9ACTN|nr:IucA/IucC family protein [Streptomyces fragilis]
MARHLADLRPDLVEPFGAALPGARAAVLTRLWRALAFEPLPWIAERGNTAGGLTVRLADGRALHGPPADPFAVDGRVTRLGLAGVEYLDPAALVEDLGVPHGTVFAAELAGSVTSLALSRADTAAAPGPSAASWEWEQRVVDGHPYHPGCRSRPGFTVADELAYAPEHRPVVRLSLLPVERERCLVSGDWPAEWRDSGRLLLPVHPWQARHVLRLPVDGNRTEIGTGTGTGTGSGTATGSGNGEGNGEVNRQGDADGFAAHPLMALRTLAVPGGPQVKTALSARLTSSVRDISPGSIASSAIVSAFAEALTPRLGGLLHVTRTLGAACDGTPDLAAVIREAPEVYAGPGERVVPVAALAAAGSVLASSWLTDLAALSLGVGLRLLELGVALEAHGQNLLAVLSPDGRPVRLVYRDLADIRVAPRRLARHGLRLPDGFPARIVTDDVTALRRKLFGSLVAGALGAAAGSSEALASVLREAAARLPSTPDREALLGDPLPTKALTLMRLSPDVPGDRWTLLPPPLEG